MGKRIVVVDTFWFSMFSVSLFIPHPNAIVNMYVYGTVFLRTIIILPSIPFVIATDV